VTGEFFRRSRLKKQRGYGVLKVKQKRGNEWNGLRGGRRTLMGQQQLERGEGNGRPPGFSSDVEPFRPERREGRMFNREGKGTKNPGPQGDYQQLGREIIRHE